MEALTEPDAGERSTATSSDPRSVAALVAALAVSLVPVGFVVARGVWRSEEGAWFVTLFDDAMISMSYARTFADGHGLVWYPGAPRVEGITNLGWTLVMAVLHRLGLPANGVAVFVMMVSTLAVWAAALVALRLSRRFRCAGPLPTFAVVVVVAANFPVLYWAVRGMEVGLVLLLAVCTVLLVWRLAEERWSPSTAAALATVGLVGVGVRSDFAVVALAATAWVLFHRPARWPRVLIPLLGGPLVGLALATAFRLWYYDRPFPNTYYLKVEGIPLGDRLGRGLGFTAVTLVMYALPLLVLVAAAWRRFSVRERRLSALVLTVAGMLALYSAYVGGDAWEVFLIPNRYVAPAVALVAVIAVVGLFALLEPGRVPQDAPPRVVLGVVVLLLGLGPVLGVVVGHTLGSSMRFGTAAVVVAGVGLVVGGLIWRSDEDRATPRWTAVAVIVMLLVSWSFRIPQTTLLGDDGNRFARTGVQLATVTTQDAVIGVSGAGGSQYYSQRASVDLLGKSDRVIAEGPPATERFTPGHNKFDLEDSIRRGRPDVIADIGFDVDPSLLERYGYLEVRPSDGMPGFATDTGRIWVRSDSPEVRWERLARV